MWSLPEICGFSSFWLYGLNARTLHSLGVWLFSLCDVSKWSKRGWKSCGCGGLFLVFAIFGKSSFFWSRICGSYFSAMSGSGLKMMLKLLFLVGRAALGSRLSGPWNGRVPNRSPLVL